MLLAGTVALVVLGPERLPKVARTVGEWVGKVQRLAANVKTELAAQADYADLKKIKAEVETAAQEIREEIKDFEQQIQDESSQIGQNLRPSEDVPAWERLPDLKTPADFGINDTSPADTYADTPDVPWRTPEPQPFGQSKSLRKQAMTRKRDARPRHRPTPKLRSRR